MHVHTQVVTGTALLRHWLEALPCVPWEVDAAADAVRPLAGVPALLAVGRQHGTQPLRQWLVGKRDGASHEAHQPLHDVEPVATPTDDAARRSTASRTPLEGGAQLLLWQWRRRVPHCDRDAPLLLVPAAAQP
eukprot:scaffold22678_cov65-Phaeocystis_antarctica.AAC.7